MLDPTDLTLMQAVQALRAGELSSRELVQAYLGRIQRLEPSLHCFLSLAPESARFQADAADRRLADWRKDPKTDLPPLLGVPLAVKDLSLIHI